MYRLFHKSRKLLPVLLWTLTLCACCTGLFSKAAPPTVAAAVREDRTAPSLSGVKDLTVRVGDSISYLSGVTARDDRDRVPTVTVGTSQVDLSRAGTYEVVYTAADASGNYSRVAALVTVLEPEKEPAADAIDAAADELLETLLEEDMTVRQQIEAIYAWARSSLIYGGHSDRTDWRQTAYAMLTEGRGDCYGYFAVTKLLFERLGIPNIDVQKVRNYDGDSDHFWSLVSADGGESWYHFDATPRLGDGDDFCMVTDAFLDAYSDAHKHSHNRDQTLYPATPEE